MTVDHVLASACLPMHLQAVEIDGEPYWDGGYSAIRPCSRCSTRRSPTTSCSCRSTRSNAGRRRGRRRRSRTGSTEITFNANLLQQLRSIEFVTRLIDDGKLSTKEYKRVLMHRIHGGRKLDEFTAASRLSAQWGFFKELKDLGRACAKRWLAENYQFIGQKSTLDLPEAYS